MTLQIDNAGLETRIECAGPAYCPGQVCCGRRKFFQANGQNMAVYDQLTCESQCAYPDIIVCDAQTQCPDLPGENGNPPVKSVPAEPAASRRLHRPAIPEVVARRARHYQDAIFVAAGS